MPNSSSNASRNNLARALQDVVQGVASVHIWSMLGWQEIRQRYRRSVVGPFWSTITSAILLGAMGPLYSKLLGQDPHLYVPFLVIGFITWHLIATMIQEASVVFIVAEPYITQLPLPFTVHVMRMVWRNALLFAHNFIVVVIVLIIFPPGWSWTPLLAVPAFALVLVNGVWMGLFFGMLCLRFRDMIPLINSLVPIAFFLTPIMWQKDLLGRYVWAAQINPFYHLLELVRAPLLGEVPSGLSWIVVTIVTSVSWAVTLLALARYRARIPYWL